MQSTESLTSMSSKVITTATPPPVDDLLEISSDLADYRLDEMVEVVDTNQPCYMGICLPRNILNLFPRRCASRPYVDVDVGTSKTFNSGDDVEKEAVVETVDETDHHVGAKAAADRPAGPMDDEEEGDTSSSSSENEPVQTTTMMTKLCLNCSRTTTRTTTRTRTTRTRTPTTTTTETTTSTAKNKTSSNLNDMINCNIDRSHQVIRNSHSTSKSSSSSSSAAADINVPSCAPSSASSTKLSKHHKKLITLRNVTDSRRIKGSMSQSVDGDNAEAQQEHTLLAILVNVQRCANPVLMKQAKMNLLELKQKHGEYFQDLCLYSEVLKAIGRNTYRQTSRRFLQELFLDIDFEVLLRELMDALRVEEREPKGVISDEVGKVGNVMDEVNGTEVISPTTTGRDTTSYGSMIHSGSSGNNSSAGGHHHLVELRNGGRRRECGKIVEEEDIVEMATQAAVRMSLPEPILSPTRSTISDSSDTTTNGGTMMINRGFARVQLSCSVNKFPVKRDRANSLNTPSTTVKDY